MRHSVLAFLVVMVCVTTSARAGTMGWLLTFENDAVFDRDEYYTNGIEISAIREPADVPAPVAAGIDWLCGAFGSSCGPDLAGSFRLIPFGNVMFTPMDIKTAQYQPYDRPYAGWTYVGAVRELVDKDGAQRDRLRTFDLRLGVVGPASRTEEFQAESHRIVGVAHPEGWSNQIGNRAGLMFRYEDKRAIAISTAPTLYLVPHAGIAFGTVYRYVNAGAFLVFGERSRPFDFVASHAQMEPSAPHFNNVEYNGANHDAPASAGGARNGRFLEETSYFVGIDARGMQYNLFIEGKSDSQIRPKRFVYDYVAGARHITASGLILSASVIQRSDEFYGAGRERFTSLTVGWLTK